MRISRNFFISALIRYKLLLRSYIKLIHEFNMAGEEIISAYEDVRKVFPVFVN